MNTEIVRGRPLRFTRLPMILVFVLIFSGNAAFSELPGSGGKNKTIENAALPEAESGADWQARLDPAFPVTINVFVTDIAESTEWYRAILGDAPIMQPTSSATAFEVVKGVWLEMLESKEVTPGDFAVRFGVKDVRAEKVRLESLGVKTGEIKQPDPRVRLFDFHDPDGNWLTFYELESITARMASPTP